MAADVDTTRMIDELEAVLNAGRERSRCFEAMAILSRRRAGAVVRRYERYFM